MGINSIRNLLGCHHFKEGTACHELSHASGGRGATVQLDFYGTQSRPLRRSQGVNPITLLRRQSHWPGFPHVAVFVAVLDFGGNPATDLARMRMEPPFG